VSLRMLLQEEPESVHFSPERGSGSRLIVLIQEPFRDDVIRTPSKVHGPALPGAEEGNPSWLDGREGVAWTTGRKPLADDDGPGPGPCVEYLRIGLELGAAPYPMVILTPP